MKKSQFVLSIASIALILCSLSDARAVNLSFSDGQAHTVNSTVSNLQVHDSTLGTTTTVHIVSPANVSFADLYNHTLGDMTGGSVAFLKVHDLGNFSFSASNISSLTVSDSATASVASGTISNLFVQNSAHADLYSGTMTHANSFNNATIDIYGGSYDFAVTNNLNSDGSTPTTTPDSHIVIHGGSIGVARADEGTVDILGGDIGAINPFADGLTNIYGGAIDDFTLGPNTVTNVYGIGLSLTFDQFIFQDPQYILSGVLQDGSPIDAQVLLPDGAELNLIAVPEPNSLCLLAMGGTLWFSVRARRRARN